MTLESMFFISQTVAAFAIVGSLVFRAMVDEGMAATATHDADPRLYDEGPVS